MEQLPSNENPICRRIYVSYYPFGPSCPNVRHLPTDWSYDPAEPLFFSVSFPWSLQNDDGEVPTWTIGREILHTVAFGQEPGASIDIAALEAQLSHDADELLTSDPPRIEVGGEQLRMLTTADDLEVVMQLGNRLTLHLPKFKLGLLLIESYKLMPPDLAARTTAFDLDAALDRLLELPE